jgi:hypothetical protein
MHSSFSLMYLYTSLHSSLLFSTLVEVFFLGTVHYDIYNVLHHSENKVLSACHGIALSHSYIIAVLLTKDSNMKNSGTSLFHRHRIHCWKKYIIRLDFEFFFIFDFQSSLFLGTSLWLLFILGCENALYIKCAEFNVGCQSVCFLSRLARYSDQNKMTEKNIAIAFGPTLMQTEADVCVC